MTPDEALATISEAAASFSAVTTRIEALWSVFHSNLHDLCRDRPLADDTLALFEAMECWEVAVGPERQQALGDVRAVARRLAMSAS